MPATITALDCCEKVHRLVQYAERDMNAAAKNYRRRETERTIQALVKSRSEYDMQRDAYRSHLAAHEGEM